MDAAIDIRPTYSAMGFTVELAPVHAVVWGQPPARLRWKQVTRLVVPAGEHAVGVWATWVTKSHMGLSHAVVRLAPGEVVGVEWKSPQTVFGTGRIAILDLDAPTAVGVPEATPVPPDLGPLKVAPPHPTRPLASVPLVAAAPAVGRWAPDPTGRAAFRWWDGTRWTDAVSDGTTTSSDPI